MKQHPNSIYYTLRNLTNCDKRKLAISYVYALLNSRSAINFSKDPLIDEGQNIYKQLSNIGRTTLDSFEKIYIEDIQKRLGNKDYQPRKRGVEKIVIDLFNKNDFKDSLEKIGNSLKKLVTEKPNLKKPINKITAGKIQMYEQQAIEQELSKYLI